MKKFLVLQFVFLAVVAMTYAQERVKVADINFDNADAGAELINKEPEFVNQDYHPKLYDNPYLRDGKSEA